MKNLKKVISLVLVVAMLASFAGMTGYSPASIMAEAATTVGTKVTYTFEDGFSLTIAESLYKNRKADDGTYGMLYRNIAGTTNQAISDNYYGISMDVPENNLAFTVNAPDTGTWKIHCSLNSDFTNKSGKSYQVAGGWGSAETAINYERPESSCMNDEYGVLFRSLNNDTDQGFRDITTIYWRLTYTNADGVTKYGYAEVKLVDYAKKGNEKTVTWTVPATSSKPLDSQAAKNQMKISVPTVFYKNSSNVILGAVDGVTFNNNVDIAFPVSATHISMKVATDQNFSDVWTIFDIATSEVQAFKNAEGTYYVWNSSNHYGDYVNNNALVNGKTVTGDLIFYRFDYVVPETLPDGSVKDITYTQFAATYVTTVPRHKIGFAIHACTNDNSGQEAKQLDAHSAIYQEMNLVNFLVNGFNLSPFANGPWSDSEGGTHTLYNSTTAPDVLWGQSSWAAYDTNYSYIRLFRLGYTDDAKSDYRWDYHFFPGYGMNGGLGEGTGTGGTDNETVMGAKFYYDSQASYSTSINANLFTTQYQVKGNSGKEYDTFPVVTGEYSNLGWSYKFDTYTVGTAPKWSDSWVSGKNSSNNGSTGITMSGSWVPTESESNKYFTTSPNLVISNSCYNGTAKNFILVFRSETAEYRGTYNLQHCHNLYYSYAMEFVPVDRSIAHSFVDAVIENNYVEEEMDPAWWADYTSCIWDEYRRLGNLSNTSGGTNDNGDGYTTHFNRINNPKYKVADYSELNEQMLTSVEWDRGGKSSDGSNPDANYLDWGASYKKWNSTTYNSDGGKVSGSLAAYDLAWNGTDLYIDTSTIRTGAYYYTSASWNAYVTARNNAAKAYNYPTNTNGFDYDTAYPAKEATANNVNIGLACYCKDKIDQAATTIAAARENLVKKEKGGEYSNTDIYKILVNATGALVYDSDSVLNVGTKHGLKNVYDAATGNHYYDSAKLNFRASHPDDVFEYVYTTQANNGQVICDENGNPQYKLADNTIVLASDINPDTGEAYDTGILYFPYTGRPVGTGNTFPQLVFDNSAASGYAVTNARTALQNRLKWGVGGKAAGYEYLGMVEGAYTENVDSTGEEKVTLTEEMLATDPTTYMWAGVEHKDDILRAAYALLRVAKTVRLATNYKQVVDILNAYDATNKIDLSGTYIPAYDAEGTTYNEKELNKVTLFQNYTTPAEAWDTVSFTVNNKTYNTTGKTWYTKETWDRFTTARDALAALVYNGSDTISGTFDYDSGIGNKYYTYDVELMSGAVYKNTYYTNGEYYNTVSSAQNLAANNQDEVNALVQEYIDAMEALKLKNLDAYTWEAYDETTVSDIENKVEGLYTGLVNEKQDVVDFESIKDGDTITGASLTTVQNSKYDPAELAELAALADAVTALHRGGAEGSKFQGSMNLADQAVAFDTALAAFNAKYEEIKDSSSYVDTSNWQEIFDHLTVLNGGTAVTTANIANMLKAYSFTDAEITAIQTIIDTDYANATTQAQVNTAVTNLYNALNKSLTSTTVITAADAAIAEAGKTFVKYNPYDMTNSPNADLVDAEGDTLNTQYNGITTVLVYADDGVNIVNTDAAAAKAKTYAVLSTYISAVNNDANTIKAKAGLATVDGVDSVLVDRGVQTDVLEAAIAEAKYAVGSGGQAEVVLPSDTTQNYNYDMYSIESVAELNKVIELAEAAATNGTTADQLAIDKLIFAIMEEMDNDRKVTASLSTSATYRSWTHTYNEDKTAIVSSDYVDDTEVDFTEENWEKYLHKNLNGTGALLGLDYTIAKYDLLAKEMLVPKTGDEKLGVWDADGNLLDKDGNVVAADSANAFGKTMYTELSWNAYVTKLKAAQSLIDAEDKLKANEQSKINEAAQAVYEARAALEYNSFASHDPGHSEAEAFYKEMDALIHATVNIYDYDVVTGKSEAIPVSIYNTDDLADVEVALTTFYALYVGSAQTPPEKNNSDESYIAMKKAANQIYAALHVDADGNQIPYPAYSDVASDLEAYLPVAPKSMNDDSFQIGWVSILEDFIAGDYTDGAYTSALLSDAQVAKLDELLDTANGFITDDGATVDAVGSFVSAVEAVYTYTTTTNATDLQFAVAMREQIEGFMDMTFTYNDGVKFYNNGVAATDYVFSRDAVGTDEDGDGVADNGYKGEIADFFNTASNWPFIYQVNDLVVSQNTTTGVFTITDEDGTVYDRTATGELAEQLIAIYDQVGNDSVYYQQDKLLDTMYISYYHADAFNWLLKNHKVTKDGNTYILADLEPDVTASSTTTVEDRNGAEATISYDVAKDSYWYSEGYGIDTDNRKYYLLEGTDEVIGSPNNGWFTDASYSALDSKLNSDIATKISSNFGVDLSADNYEITAQIGAYDNKAAASRFYISYQYMDIIRTNGWDKTTADKLKSAINNEQKIIDDAAQGYYEQIQALELLPATAAYREIEKIYQAAMGNSVVSFNGTEVTAAETEALGYATFYNVTDEFLAQIGKNNYSSVQISGEATPDGDTAAIKAQGYGYTASLPTQYDQTSEEWLALEAYHTNFASNMLTIDKAADVTTDEVIELIAALTLVKYNFDDLNALVTAFFANGIADDEYVSKLQRLRSEEYDFETEYGFGEYPYSMDGYPTAEYYTAESLEAVVTLLFTSGVIKEDLYKAAIADDYAFSFTFTQAANGGNFYSNPEYDEADYGDASIVALTKAVAAAIMDLRLKPADTTKLDAQIALAADIVTNSHLYLDDDFWTAFEEAKATAESEREMCNYTEDGGYYTKLSEQEYVDEIAKQLADAIANLNKCLDNVAPQMTVSANNTDVEEFYNAAANKAALAEKDAAGSAKPVTGSFIMPNNGYSLLVYTNELNPRIVLNIQDYASTETNAIAAVKREKLSASAVRTSGVEANLIYGTMDASGAIVDVNKAAVTNGGAPVSDYTNTLATTENSSIFAVIAPTFKEGTYAQAAKYTIVASDGLSDTEEGADQGASDNYVRAIDLGIENEPVQVVAEGETEITVYVYYVNTMSDTNDEGIDASGNATTPATNSDHVASVYLSGEPGYTGTWRNGLLLSRSFSNRHNSWEYVSPVMNNEVNGVGSVPVYYDPTFGYLNTGSFYYVLNSEVEADAAVIATYNEGNDAADGLMDYDRATAAKDAMIAAIKAENSTVFADMKASGRFYSYGDYQRDENGNIIYSGTTPLTINWTQSLNKKVENGDLVFVHVVDRWGNVVNRIIEITNLDKIAPVLSAATGALGVEEDGGSGIKDIQVGNGMTSEGAVNLTNYNITDSNGQNVTSANGSNMVVNCAGNTVTLSGLTAGRNYYINVIDNAGNIKNATVRAAADGTIAVTVANTDVTTESDGSVATTFTLNGTDTIVLNSGETSSIIDASLEGNVFANRAIRHVITTYDTVTQLKTVYQDGTVEEWTADNATVTDNGDGTLTWVIKRTLAEGEHNYKVYAMVGGEYETFYAPATITATTKSVKITYRVIGMGKTVLQYSGSIAIKNANYNSLSVPYGSEVSITADTNVEGCEFYYWINNYTERIISTANVYTFTAVTNADYIAQFTNSATYYDGKKLVVYVNNAKNVIERFELAEGDTYTVPSGPVLPDYTFKGWSMTKAEVLASDKDTVIVEPIYTLSAENTVTITEGNYTATGAGTYTAEDNQRAVVTISTTAKDNDGNEFLYWLDDDTNEIVSYDRTYSFFCVKDTVLTPVYGDASTIKVSPIVRITEVRYSALSGKVSFFAERSIPDEFTLLQTGIVVTKTESIGTNDEVFVVGGTSTAAGTSTSTANNGYYSASTAITTGQTVWARAYAIYETADGEILEAYGPVTSYTVE